MSINGSVLNPPTIYQLLKELRKVWLVETLLIYSLVASCKLNGIDPFVYFRDVLEKVSTHPAGRIDELLPCNWKKPNSGTEDDTVIKDQIVQVA